MPDVAEQPHQPTDRRGRRVYIWWAVALTLLALLGVFCWAVVVPVWRVDAVVRDMTVGKLNEKEAIDRLGGPESAAKQLVVYLRTPGKRSIRIPSGEEGVLSAPPSYIARSLLMGCGQAAVDFFVGELHSSSLGLREEAAAVLGDIGDVRAVKPLEAALNDQHQQVRQAAAEALDKIKAAQEKAK